MRIINGRVFDLNEGFVSREVFTDGALLAASGGDAQLYDAEGCYVIPGLTDVHFHGCMGADFSDGDPDGLQTMADYELSRGVTQICPAGMTLLEEQLSVICKMAAAHKRKSVRGAELVGVHLEGPFLSYAKKGAQNGEWLHKPDAEMFRRLMTAADGLIRLVTVAPEEAGAIEFIRAVSEQATVSLGHTTADYDTAMEAYRSGASHTTHLFNAMPPFTHRAPGVVGAAADQPHVRVELICDGVHLHPSVVRAAFKLFGAERVVLVSDSLRCTGMPDGQYPFGGQEIVLKGNRATLLHEPNTLAGSVTDLMGCMKKAVEFGIPLADAVRAAAVNPAQAIGIFDRFGSLDAGKAANLVILDGDLNLKDVIFHGKRLEGN